MPAASTVSQAPRNDSAPMRSSIPAKLTSSRPECQREASTVSGPASGGSVASTEPTAKRSPGSSVRTSTDSSPRSPCGRSIRPTTRDSSITLQPAARPARGAQEGRPPGLAPRVMAKPPAGGGQPSPPRRAQLPDLVHIQQVDPHVTAAGQGADDGAQRPGGAPAPADHLAQVVRVHADLKDPAPAQPVTGDADVVGVIRGALGRRAPSRAAHGRAALGRAAPGTGLLGAGFLGCALLGGALLSGALLGGPLLGAGLLGGAFLARAVLDRRVVLRR